MRLDVVTERARTGTRRGTILFLHGAWSWLWYWQPYFLPYFAAQDYDAVAFSLRGHGASEGHAQLNNFSIGDYVRDLRSVAETLDNPLIVGHSMGGFITQAYLTRHPARGAVLLASAAPKPLYGQLFRIFLDDPLSMLRTAFNRSVASSVTDLDGRRRSAFSREPDDRSMDIYLNNVQGESYRALASLTARGLRHPERVKTPLLVLGAGKDRLVSPDAVALTGKLYRTTPIIFPEMSHMMMVEPGWQAVADQIIAFEESLPRV